MGVNESWKGGRLFHDPYFVSDFSFQGRRDRAVFFMRKRYRMLGIVLLHISVNSVDNMNFSEDFRVFLSALAVNFEIKPP